MLQPGTYTYEILAKDDATFAGWRSANASNVKITGVLTTPDRSTTAYQIKVIVAVPESPVGKATLGKLSDLNPITDPDHPGYGGPDVDPLAPLKGISTGLMVLGGAVIVLAVVSTLKR